MLTTSRSDAVHFKVNQHNGIVYNNQVIFGDGSRRAGLCLKGPVNVNRFFLLISFLSPLSSE